MNEAQFQIFVNEVKSEWKTDAWLRENGINPSRLKQEPLEVNQAQKIAKNLLTNFGSLMTAEQITIVQKFFKASRNHLQQSKLTKKTCRMIMDIGAAVNRKQFAINRKLKHKK